MSRFKARLLVGAALAAAAVGLAACGDDNNSVASTPVTSTPVVQPPRFSLFGTAFAAAFDASANTDPREANAGDAPALTLTAEPAEVA